MLKGKKNKWCIGKHSLMIVLCFVVSLFAHCFSTHTIHLVRKLWIFIPFSSFFLFLFFGIFAGESRKLPKVWKLWDGIREWFFFGNSISRYWEAGLFKAFYFYTTTNKKRRELFTVFVCVLVWFYNLQ